VTKLGLKVDVYAEVLVPRQQELDLPRETGVRWLLFHRSRSNL